MDVKESIHFRDVCSHYRLQLTVGELWILKKEPNKSFWIARSLYSLHEFLSVSNLLLVGIVIQAEVVTVVRPLEEICDEIYVSASDVELSITPREESACQCSR